MKLKVLFDSRGNHYLATESGEILGMFGLHGHDPEWIGLTRKNSIDAPSTAKIVIEITKIEYISSTIEGSVVPEHALPEAPQVVEYDYDPNDYAPLIRDDEEEWEIMEGLCPDCVQELCPVCEECRTPGCEAEECDCPL